jgi:N-acetylgalactosamine-6-sulfatase
MGMRTCWTLVAVSLGVTLLCGPAAGQVPPARPNVVIILADDLGSGDLGCYGCPDIRTPHLDRLARQGVRFTSFYANGPECTPTRTALLTGRYQHRVGGLECALGLGNVGRYDDAIRLRQSNDLGLPAAESALPRLLKGAGYATAITGKWHLGYEPKFLPNNHGFDYAFGPLGGAVDYFHHVEPDGAPMLYQNGQPVRRTGYMTDLITAEAEDVIRRSKDRPFFLYVPYTAPHSPFQGPGDKPERPLTLEEGQRGSREVYRAMVERLDQGAGKVLQALDEAGVAERTLVIFASDNGGPRHARNAPLAGGKGGLFEGGIRVPCIVRWPGVLAAGTESNLPALTMDLTASVVRVAGAEPPKDRPFDGIDILRSLETKQPAPARPLFWRARRGDRTWWAVRDGALKYVARRDGDQMQEHLFDLARDPGEKDNLLARRPDDVRRLKGLLAAWEKDVQHAR